MQNLWPLYFNTSRKPYSVSFTSQLLHRQGLPGRLKRPSLAPAGQEFLLLRRQSVDAHTNGFELHCGHLVVYLPGEQVYDVIHRGVFVREVVGAEGLDREGEVHDLDGVPVTRCQVDDHATPDEVQSTAAGGGELLDVTADLARRGGRKGVHIYLHVHPAGVGQDRTVPHPLEVRGRKHVAASCRRDKDLPDLSGVQGRQHVEPVRIGFEAAHGVHLADGDAGAESRGVAGDALAAPSVAEHDDAFAADHQVGALHDRRERGLASPVAVVEEIFAPGVVRRDNRELEHSLPLHGPELRHPARRLLRSPTYAVEQVAAGSVRQPHQPRPVVYEDRLAPIERPVKHPLELAVSRFGWVIRGGVDGYAPLGQGCGHVVLHEERPRACHGDLRSGFGQYYCQIGGLRLYGEGHTDAEAIEGTVLEVFFADNVQNRRVLRGPVDFFVSIWREAGILDDGFSLHILPLSSGFLSFCSHTLLDGLHLLAHTEHEAADEDEEEEGDQPEPDAQVAGSPLDEAENQADDGPADGSAPHQDGTRPL